MPIFVLRNNEQFGPFELDELTRYVQAGNFLPTDYCWQEGWEEWFPIHSIVSLPAPVAVPLPSPLQFPTASRAASPGVSRRKPFIAGGAAMAVLLVCYLASPFWSLYRLKGAVERNDAVYVTDQVDFPQLRESFKGTMMAQMAKETVKGEAEGVEALGAAFGVMMIGPMVDALVTPEGLISMMQGRGMDLETPDSAVDSLPDETPDTEKPKRAMDVSTMGYETLNRFTVTLAGNSAPSSEEKSITLLFSRRGLFTWQLSGLRMMMD